MQKDELDLILKELYLWNPNLKDKEVELIDLIKLMVKAKPDTKFDQLFAQSLKKDLLSHRILLDNDDGLKENNFLFNLKNMNKKIYMAVGAVAVVGVFALMLTFDIASQNKTLSLLVDKANEDQFVRSNPGAFGSLSSLSGTAVAQNSGGGTVARTMESAIPMANNVGVNAVTEPLLIAGDTINSKMIAPMFSYKYVYKGEVLDLTAASGTVYRRIKGDGNLSNNLDSLISTKSFGPISLKSFSNLQTSNISLMEDKRLGLNINIDFKEENIYIGQNWTKWQSERDNCGDNQACWDSYRIKISDTPEDSTVIDKTNNFLASKGIKLDHYGEAVVDNNWRLSYEKSTDQANYYIPEEVSVIYPLTVDGQTVYDQSGNLDGLRVSYNLLHKAVSGVNNLTSYRYETSEYSLSNDSAKIIALAEKGGYGSGIYYYDQNQNPITLELGTPTKSLIHLWRYSNNANEELLIPALIFPINNIPDNYYGSRYITVPLVQEMIDELSNNSGGSYGGGIMPMVR